MFIKKYVKSDKIYYMLVIVEQTNDDKPHFINCFIPEQLALILNKNGIDIKEK